MTYKGYGIFCVKMNLREDCPKAHCQVLEMGFQGLAMDDYIVQVCCRIFLMWPQQLVHEPLECCQGPMKAKG